MDNEQKQVLQDLAICFIEKLSTTNREELLEIVEELKNELK